MCAFDENYKLINARNWADANNGVTNQYNKKKKKHLDCKRRCENVLLKVTCRNFYIVIST